MSQAVDSWIGALCYIYYDDGNIVQSAVQADVVTDEVEEEIEH